MSTSAAPRGAARFSRARPHTGNARMCIKKEVLLTMHHNLPHLIHGAMHEKDHPKLAGVMLIIVGLFLTPFVIGIPILLLGMYKLST
jgi:hypothetical protein